MRRAPPMLRRHFTALSALSLLLCVAVAVLWVRSYRGAGSWVEVGTRQGRFTLKSEPGRLLLDGPPPRGAGDGTAEALVARLGNDHVQWESLYAKPFGFLFP